MEALALPFLFTSILACWIGVELTLRAYRRREAAKAKEEEEARKEASRRLR